VINAWTVSQFHDPSGGSQGPATAANRSSTAITAGSRRFQDFDHGPAPVVTCAWRPDLPRVELASVSGDDGLHALAPDPQTLLSRPLVLSMRLSLVVLFALSCLCLHGCGKASNTSSFDLIVSNVSATNPAPLAGQATVITFTVHFATTYGLSLANIPWTVTRDGVEGFLAGGIPLIQPNGDAITSFSITETVVGQHVYAITIDPQNIYNETDFSNNTTAITVTIGASPVLGQYELFFSEQLACVTTEPVATKPITLDCAVANSSNTGSTATAIPWSLSRDGIAGFLTGTITAILPDTAVPLSLTFTDTAGAHTYVLTLDPQDTLPENDTLNNTSEPVDITVGPAPPTGTI
jgi:hypothetical protein